jgi:hypothetical protein
MPSSKKSKGPSANQYRISKRQAPESRGGERRSPPKHKSEDDIEVLAVREVEKQRRLYWGSISIPLNNAVQFWNEEQEGLVYLYPPSDNTSIKRAIKRGYDDKIVWGWYANRIVERLMNDKRSTQLWTVPKVNVVFNRIDYVSGQQAQTSFVKQEDGLLVDPKSQPTVEEMSATEYEVAVESGNWRVAPCDGATFEHCLDMDVGWLPYSMR